MFRKSAFAAAMILAAAATAAQAGVKPAEFGRRLSEKMLAGYPIEFLRDGKSAGAVVEMWIDEKGAIASCTILQSFGDPQFASQSCKLLKRSGKLTPAKDETGKPILGRVLHLAKWYLPDSQQGDLVASRALREDATVALAGLPAGTAPQLYNVPVGVDVTGKVTHCGNDGAEADSPMALICAHLPPLNLPVGKGADGAPAPYVTSVSIVLKAAPAG